MLSAGLELGRQTSILTFQLYKECPTQTLNQLSYHECSIVELLNHHHHHLFLKRPFLPRSARVRRLPRYEASPHIPEHRPFRVQTKLVHGPCLPLHILSMSSYPCPHISPPPPPHFYRPTPNHLRSYVPHAQTTSIYHASPLLPGSEYPKDCTSPHFSSYPQRHTTHPSHHHALCSFQAMQILGLHCPCLSPIYINTLWTQALKIFPFMWCDAPRAVRMGDSSLNLAQAHRNLALAAS